MTNPKNHWLLPVICGVLLAITIIISLLVLNRRTGGKVIKGLSFLLSTFPAKIRRKGQEILEQIAIFQAVGWRFHLTVALITVTGTLAGGVIIYILAARGASVTAPVGVFVWLWAVVYILKRVPISIANLGVREATLVGLLSIYGVETSAALLMSMILFSGSVFIAGIGAIYQLRWSLRTGRKVTPSAKP